MIIMNMEQRSESWFAEKCGRFGASKFATLMSGLSTKGYKDLITDIAGEVITGEIEETYTNEVMQRGIDLEPEARAELSAILGVDINEVGLCLPEDPKLIDWIGVSPDGITSNGLPCEIKCPILRTYLNRVIANKLPSEHRWQVQGQIFVTGAPKAYYMNYYPNLKPFIIEVKRDEQMQADLKIRFHKAIEDVKAILKLYKNFESI